MIFDSLLDLFRGQAVTIPPLDGALKPNTLLDEAEVVREAAAPDNLVVLDGAVLFSSGNTVLNLADGKPVAQFDAPVSAMAASPSGALAIGLDSGHVMLRGSLNGSLDGFGCPTALAFGADGSLYVANGSETHAPSQWAADLMRKQESGSLWKVDATRGARTCLAKDLAFPCGAVVDEADGQVVVSEAWKHRIIAVPLAGGRPRELAAKLPGYPARIAAARGGYVMSLFAPRNRLIEFVLEEDAYREDMLREIDPRFWIAPSLSPMRSFLEPLQNGGVRTMGIHKPWSPTRSYGLVMGLDAQFQPAMSFHSRANGTRHGITSVIAHGGAILAAAKGGDVILRIDHGGEGL